jgi:hypothetical protein
MLPLLGPCHGAVLLPVLPHSHALLATWSLTAVSVSLVPRCPCRLFFFFFSLYSVIKRKKEPAAGRVAVSPFVFLVASLLLAS